MLWNVTHAVMNNNICFGVLCLWPEVGPVVYRIAIHSSMNVHTSTTIGQMCGQKQYAVKIYTGKREQ